MNRIKTSLLAVWIAAGLAGCGNSSNPAAPPLPPPPPPPTSMNVTGVVTDGPVSGGSLFLFAAADVQGALDSIDPGGERLAGLNAAPAIVSLTRNPADGDQYTLTVPAERANQAAFLIFDNTDAEDAAFADTPPNLESVAILGDAGTVQRVNVSLQTTLIAQLVRVQLDPDGDGTIIDDAAIAMAIDDATASIVSAFATDALGRDLYPGGFNPVDHDDDAEVHAASAAIGSLIRAAGFLEGATFDEVVQVLAMDAADGALDGSIPVDLAPTPEQEALAASISDVSAAGSDRDIAVYAVGPCSSAAVAMQQACSANIADDFFQRMAVCSDTLDDIDRVACETGVDAAVEEQVAECDDIFAARLQLCEDLGDAAHDPAFGAGYAAGFVNPLDIGVTVEPNPWFPLVTGNRWVYEGDAESIEVEVTDETKLVDGITCIVVTDTASEDGVVVEMTRDWYAQDVDGNVWYCGEIARNYESFDADEPPTPELVDIDGSWKAGRDRAEPGILLPHAPEVDAVIRQEVAYGIAEDFVRIGSVTASESAPGGACNGDCLMTTDLTPLEPDAEENKFYAPGIGLIVEIDVTTGDRVELIEFSSTL